MLACAKTLCLPMQADFEIDHVVLRATKFSRHNNEGNLAGAIFP
jgi:hypothetical protein